MHHQVVLEGQSNRAMQRPGQGGGRGRPACPETRPPGAKGGVDPVYNLLASYRYRVTGGGLMIAEYAAS